MSSASFRKIDIDRVNPDSPVNQLPEIVESGVTLDDIQALNREVKAQLSSGDGAAALQTSLALPPYGSDKATKDAALATVLQVLSTVRVSEIDGAVQSLSPADQTVLVKYLFKASGSSKGKQHGAAILNWMERTFAIAGQGAIMKHMTDRRTV